ncbi:MAG TPA: GNAT family N-acetyltransferase, partial [Chitinophagaceae bacterium]|nr:GNAT family N-acetyltransferase [Chitinophagaceae bacterium]
ANITPDKVVISHQGLTYGGFVLRPDEKLISSISIVHSALKFFYENDIPTFNIKCLPSFYNPQYSEELEYILFLLGAELYRRDTSLVIDKRRDIGYSGNVRREANKAEKLSSKIVEEGDPDAFWNLLLIPNLRNKYGAAPVHSIEEIQLLKKRFPGNIRQFSVYLEGSIVAGTTLFVTPHVVHCQYISSNDEGRKSGCLNLLFRHLVEDIFPSYRFFDFGIVNENDGSEINTGMLFWKESFGARTQKQDFYRVRTASYTSLEKFLR